MSFKHLIAKCRDIYLSATTSGDKIVIFFNCIPINSVRYYMTAGTIPDHFTYDDGRISSDIVIDERKIKVEPFKIEYFGYPSQGEYSIYIDSVPHKCRSVEEVLNLLKNNGYIDRIDKVLNIIRSRAEYWIGQWSLFADIVRRCAKECYVDLTKIVCSIKNMYDKIKENVFCSDGVCKADSVVVGSIGYRGRIGVDHGRCVIGSVSIDGVSKTIGVRNDMVCLTCKTIVGPGNILSMATALSDARNMSYLVDEWDTVVKLFEDVLGIEVKPRNIDRRIMECAANICRCIDPIKELLRVYSKILVVYRYLP